MLYDYNCKLCAIIKDIVDNIDRLDPATRSSINIFVDEYLKAKPSTEWEGFIRKEDGSIVCDPIYTEFIKDRLIFVYNIFPETIKLYKQKAPEKKTYEHLSSLMYSVLRMMDRKSIWHLCNIINNEESAIRYMRLYSQWKLSRNISQ